MTTMSDDDTEYTYEPVQRPNSRQWWTAEELAVLNQVLAEKDARIAELEARLVAQDEKATHYYRETAALVAETVAENKRLTAQLAEAQTWQPISDGEVTRLTRVHDGGKTLSVLVGEYYDDWCAMDELPDDVRLFRRTTQTTGGTE